MATQRGNSWQGRVVNRSLGIDKRFSFPTRAKAEQWEVEAREALKAGRELPLPDTLGSDYSHKPTLLDLFDKYGADVFPDHGSYRCSSETKRAASYLPDKPANDLTNPDLIRMVAKCKNEKKAPATINAYFSRIRRLLRYAKALGEVDVELEFPKQKIGDNARYRFLTEEEEQALITLLRHWGLPAEAHLVGFMVDTGVRPGEIIESSAKGDPVKWSEISRCAGGTMNPVRDPKTGKDCPVIHLNRTKTGNRRVLPLTDRARDALLWSKDQGHDRPFEPISLIPFREKVEKAAEHLGLEDVVVYTFRHTCASRLVQRGADLRRVKDWMGHTDIKTTLKYAKLTPTDIFELEGLL